MCKRDRERVIELLIVHRMMNDFDKNGEMDKIMTYTIDGKDMPVFLKRDMEDQMPGLKKKNLRHGDYATRSIQDLFSKELIQSSVVKQFDYCLIHLQR